MYSWSCIENCGACCKFDLINRSNLENKLTNEDFDLIETLTGEDGWCINFDKSKKHLQKLKMLCNSLCEEYKSLNKELRNAIKK